jgi:hypothetical protein
LEGRAALLRSVKCSKALWHKGGMVFIMPM